MSVAPDRKALARELDEIVDQRRIAQAHMPKGEREDFDASPEARAAVALRLPAQAEVEEIRRVVDQMETYAHASKLDLQHWVVHLRAGLCRLSLFGMPLPPAPPQEKPTP